jgi:hypothetical protein
MLTRNSPSVDSFLDLSLLPKSEGEPFKLEDAPQTVSKRWEKVIWEKDGWWHAAMIGAGKKTPMDRRIWPHDYWTMDKPAAGTGVNLYILDTGINVNLYSFWTKVNNKPPAEKPSRARHFGDKQGSDRSPYVNDIMVSYLVTKTDPSVME